MAQRILEKLDKLQKFEKKIMRKYELLDNPEQERVQYNPFVKGPLTREFKLDYELSADAKKRMSASPGLLEYGQSAFQCVESVCRPRSAVSLQLPRKKYSVEPVLRPFSAPASLKSQKENLQHLGKGFMILKLKTRPSTEGQKKPKAVPGNCVDMMQMLPDNQDTSKILDRIEVSCDDSTAVTRDRQGEATVTAGKEDKPTLTTIYEKSSAEPIIRSDTLLSIDLANEIEKMTKSLTKKSVKEVKEVCFHDSVWKEKKPLVPLCIEDEIEKPNAKIIRTDDLGVRPSSSMKASESFPIYCNNEGYVQKYVLNRWLALYGDKAFYDTSKKNEVLVRLNPVLQNNFSESFAVLRSHKHAVANITIKRKKKPIFSKKKMIPSLEILSLERSPTLPAHPKERPFVPILSDSFCSNRDYPIWRHSLLQRNISQTIPKCRKDVFMLYGINPNTDAIHDASTSSLISRIKSQFPGCIEKPVVQCVRRSRLVHVDYIPISKPISTLTSETELPSHNPSFLVQPVMVVSDSFDDTSIERDKAHPHVSDKKHFLGEGRLGGTQFLVSRYTTPSPEDGKRPTGATSALPPQSSPSEPNDNPKPTKVNQLASCAEEQEALLPGAAVISIPTAKDDASGLHRNPKK